MANIKDVALHASVSVTTVSHVVNGTRFVSEVARQRVEAAVRELGYVPSAVARSLKHNTTRTFGMVIPNNSNPYFAEIIQGVEARSFAAGYNVILCNSNDDPERQAAYRCDVLYATASALVFDYLGDNGLILSADQRLQQGLDFAIVDEADSVLIDEARTPLAISGRTSLGTSGFPSRSLTS